jgi:biopolymer transport protein ExbD
MLVVQNYVWPAAGIEERLLYLWRWTSLLGRLDVVLLALLLTYVIWAIVSASRKLNVLARTPSIDTKAYRAACADVHGQAKHLDLIACIAPYLGLMGTSEGILNSFMEIGMQKDTALAVMSSVMGASLVPAACGILVAIAATCSYNFLQSHIEHVETLTPVDFQPPRTRKPAMRPIHRRFESSRYGLLAAIGLAIILVSFLPFTNRRGSRGLDVDIGAAACEYDSDDRMLVIRMKSGGAVFLNDVRENWSELPDVLGRICSRRGDSRVFLLADDDLPFQQVAEAIELLQHVPVIAEPEAQFLNVRLILPSCR